ncbi:MAG: exodeoxyribonuclease VII large subunit [Erysipelotrichaceae bacterium]|nr:exodeoxyribonuclease VII large subunit [Erysipelotrichaceae bacterium]
MSKISVSTLVRYLKHKLDSDEKLQGVMVSGELSNFHRHNSGHLYFTLKDEKASISCVMFASKAAYLKFSPKNGDKVVLSANTSLFEVSGQLQLYVNNMKLDGLGDLYQQYEELKNRLAKEGYFNDLHKVGIKTAYPEKVAVIVGDKSAAMSDINTQFNRRWPLCQVDYYPSLVQGMDAPKDIIRNLLVADDKDYDAIILARGGGSFEDLFCFNDEQLVKTIYSLKTFIITGIGHEQDFTLADFVADLRAPTPTATVELITPNIMDVNEEINGLKHELSSLIKDKINNHQKESEKLSGNRYLLNPELLIDKTILKIDYYCQRLSNFSKVLDNIDMQITNYQKLMKLNLDKKIFKINNNLKNCSDLLNAYSLNSTLKRGFSIVSVNNKIVSSVNDLKVGDTVDIRLSDGIRKGSIKE